MANESVAALSSKLKKYVTPDGDIDPDASADADDTKSLMFDARVEISGDGSLITITRSSR